MLNKFILKEEVIFKEDTPLTLRELCRLLNKYYDKSEKYEYLFEEASIINSELERELKDVNDKKEVYAQLSINLAKKLGFNTPEELFNAIDDGFLIGNK